MLACFVWLATTAFADDTNQPSINSPLTNSELLDQLEDKVEILSNDTLVRMVPALAKLLELQESTLDWRILQLLTKADLTAIRDPQPLVEAVSRLLDDSQQATRALAVSVLCNVGEPAIAAAVTHLESTRPRVRACSTVVLFRQGKLLESDAIRISHDADARVRVATIAALGKTRDGINALIAMLADEETAVACCAVEHLGRLPEKHEPEIIVRALANALSRPEVSFFAARSLGRMGSDARSAIPNLLAACPVGKANGAFPEDMVKLALAHIGEPRREDITEVVSLIENGDIESRILACQTLERFGTKAAFAAAVLEKMIRLDLAQDRKQDEDLEPDSDQYQGYLIAAEAELRAYWFTTRDPLAFRSLAEEWPDQFWLGYEFWSALEDAEKIELISCCVQSSNAEVVSEALKTIAYSFPMHLLEPTLQSMLQADTFEDRELLANAWLSTLAPTQPNVEDRVLAALERSLISVDQFAGNAQRLNCGSSRSLGVLLEGVKTKSTAQRCGAAYLKLTTNRIQAIEDFKKQSNLGSEWLAGVIASQKWDAPEMVSFADTAMHSSDYWTRIYGIEILGNIGTASSKSAPKIRTLFEQDVQKNRREISDLATACAVAIVKIEGDTAYVDRLLQHIAYLEENNELNARYFDYSCQEILQDIIVPDSKYTDLVVARLNNHDPLRVEEIDDRTDLVDRWIRLALRTQSPQARECVVRLSYSKDAILARLAKERLRDEQ